MFELSPNTKVGENFTQMIVKGKGFGHGVGMSQNGGKYLAQNRGWNADEILNYYYKSIDLCTVYGSNPAYSNCLAIN